MNSKDLYWLAGLLEGEGYFRFNGGSPQVGLRMTDRDIVERAAALMGVDKIRFQRERRKPHWNTIWQVYVHGDKALEIMKRLLPLMGKRRGERIRAVLEEASLRTGPALGSDNGQSKLTAGNVAEMRSLRNLRKRTISSIAREFGISYSAARSAIIGETWSHIG